MTKTGMLRHRQSVALLPTVKSDVDSIVEKTGLSKNRAIERAVEFYARWLNFQQNQGKVISLKVEDAKGDQKEVAVLLN